MNKILLSFLLCYLWLFALQSLSAEQLTALFSKDWKNPTLIGSSSERSLKAQLAPELLGLLENERVHFNAAASLDFEPNYDADWHKATNQAWVNNLESIDISKPFGTKRGLIFGGPEVLNQEPDETVKAKKILANIDSLWAQQQLIDYNLQLLLLNDAQLQRVQSWRLTRLYPGFLGVANSNQFFRESIKTLSPQALAGFNWLTFRFYGVEEDLQWLYSPAIKLSRQLTAANRSDPLLRYEFSADDFFVWSGKNEAYAIRIDKEVQLLSPFEHSRNLPVSQTACRSVDLQKSDRENAAERWNYISHVFENGAAWLPTHMILTPRPLWRIELTPNDPFVTHGRQILYVDRELFLPYYKFVYDRSGRLSKTIIGSFGFLGDSKTRRIPISSFVLSYSHMRREATIVDATKVTTCDSQQSGMQLSDFEPSKLGPIKVAN